MTSLAAQLVLLASLAATPLAFAATETRDLPDFNAITSQGAYNLVVTAGQKQSVTLEGENDLLGRIKTSVTGGKLEISITGSKDHGWKDKVTITIGVPLLKEFHFEGVGATTLNQLRGEQFRLNYQGVGSLTATGMVQKLVLRAQGIGTLDAKGLTASEAQVRIEGMGSVQVRATESLDARVEGLGTLTYYGKPKLITKSAQGIGNLRAGD